MSLWAGNARPLLGGGRFLLEGPEGSRAALEAGHLPEILLATERAAPRHAGLVNLARQRGAQVALVAEPVLSALAATTTPQGLVAVLPSVVRPLEALPASPRLVCVLAEVRDPGNAGTVLRAADAFGADAVVTTRGSVDPESPKAVRAAAGSLFHLPVVAGVPWPALRTALLDITQPPETHTYKRDPSGRMTAVAEIPVEWAHDDRSKIHPIRDGFSIVMDMMRVRWFHLRGDYARLKRAE